jgi:hypothetical protein
MRIWLAAILLAAGPASAEAPPATHPTRDVDVTYRVPVPSAPGTDLLQRFRWNARTRQQRVDLPTSGNWMVVDFATHRMEMVREATHEVLDLPAPDTIDLPGDGAGFSRRGDATVAGFPCVEWQTVDRQGQATLACYTADGVLLRARAGDRTLMEAISLHYVAQDPAVFEMPPDYTHQQAGR